MDCGSLIILTNALILGVRHGVDWDHIAAIADIVGSSTTAKIDGGGAISVFRQSNALRLSSCYALGHATIVLILGLAALMFAAVLPEWIDPLMEKGVGFTLLLLGIWIFYSLMRQQTDHNFVLQSRWMLLLSKLRLAADWLRNKVTGESGSPAPVVVNQYDAPAALGIGVIHGFGAETGTQVLLIAAVGGSANHVLGVLILLSFILGLLISNTLVAVLTCAGFLSSAKFKPLFVATSVATGVFSLIIGTLFVSGNGNMLPDLQH